MPASMVKLIGDGTLADLVAARLQRLAIAHEHVAVSPAELPAAVPAPDQASEKILHVTLLDGWMPAATEAWLQARVPWLRAEAGPGRALVGPTTLPGEPGCAACVDRRLLANPKDRLPSMQLAQTLTQSKRYARNPGVSTHLLSLLAEVVVDEIARFTRGQTMRTRDRVLLTRLDALDSGFFHFLPDSSCPWCARRPDDTAEAATVRLQPRPKSDPTAYRVNKGASLRPLLEEHYTPGPTSVFDQAFFSLDNPFAVCSVSIPLRLGHNEVGIGRSFSFEHSRTTAMLEGLERYAGWHSGGKKITVRAPYQEVKAQALDPMILGHHDDESYDSPGFPFVRFDPAQSWDWVWGYSFAQQRPILVPARYAYYGLQYENPQERGTVYEISNGCALGSVLEEAILYGIFEIIERDAFLMTWYARLPLPEVDLTTCQDMETRLMVERLTSATGYRLRVFDATLETGIPSVWSVAMNQRPDGPAIVCAGGAHLDPYRAIQGTLHELAGTVVNMENHYRTLRPRVLPMLDDPLKVTQMEEHAQINCLPEAAPRFAFLTEQGRAPVPMSAAFSGALAPAPDLTDDLQRALARITGCGLDVIVVDQTTPELERAGVVCVKVIIPGMLPMTFGHRMRRVRNLPRLLDLPARLGFSPRPLDIADINPYPHPFP